MIDEEIPSDWRINYNLEMPAHTLADFWRGITPYGAVLALKAAVEEIERLQTQLAEARELLSDDELDPRALLISGWDPTDDTGYPCEEWVKRRDALLVALAGEESE